jgi:hypothetical protein
MSGNNKDRLPHLAWEIKSALDLAEKGKQDRIKGLVDAAIALREARLLLKADVRFSQWCADNEFGPDVLNAHDRAALIAMADDPERMRSLLTNSERQSARYIYQYEWSAAESDGNDDSTNADNTAGSNDSADGDESSENRFAYAGKPQEAQQKQQFGRNDRKRSGRMKRSIFTVEEFNLIRSCLHPDGERTEDMKNRAFVLFNDKKFVLTGVR